MLLKLFHFRFSKSFELYIHFNIKAAIIWTSIKKFYTHHFKQIFPIHYYVKLSNRILKHCILESKSLKLHLDARGIIFIPPQLRKETQIEHANTGSVLLLFNLCPWTDSLNLTVKVMRPLQMISQVPLLIPTTSQSKWAVRECWDIIHQGF